MSETPSPHYPEASKLIIVRGQSGSGKSTSAKEVQRLVAESGQPIGVVDQDYYKEVMILPKAATRELRREKMYDDARFLLERGCHVIIDGTLDPEEHKPRIDHLVESHPTNNYMFFFNLSFEETLRRHATRPKATMLSETDLRGWYKPFSAMGYDFEIELTPEMDLETVVSTIISISGILRVQRAGGLSISGNSTPDIATPES